MDVPDRCLARPGVQKMFSAGAILSSPVVVDDTIYVGSADGYVYAIS